MFLHFRKCVDQLLDVIQKCFDINSFFLKIFRNKFCQIKGSLLHYGIVIVTFLFFLSNHRFNLIYILTVKAFVFDHFFQYLFKFFFSFFFWNFLGNQIIITIDEEYFVFLIYIVVLLKIRNLIIQTTLLL